LLKIPVGDGAVHSERLGVSAAKCT